jgi:hypothetical protein
MALAPVERVTNSLGSLGVVDSNETTPLCPPERLVTGSVSVVAHAIPKLAMAVTVTGNSIQARVDGRTSLNICCRFSTPGLGNTQLGLGSLVYEGEQAAMWMKVEDEGEKK